MGESACLVRSFSHPSDTSRESKEGDPHRALGESISFGRFMSESLAWEKWSAFSHNRYLEEVEKFSKPGYVAQQKAYFEAHYKKKAAQKAGEANVVTASPMITSEAQNEKDIKIDNCLVALEQEHEEKGDFNDAVDYLVNMKKRSDEKISEPEKDVEVLDCSADMKVETSPPLEMSVEEIPEPEKDAEVVDCLADKKVSTSLTLERRICEIPEVEKDVEMAVQQDNDVMKSTHVEDHNKIGANIEEKMPNKESVSKKKKLSGSSLKLIAQSEVMNIPSYSAKKGSRTTTYMQKIHKTDIILKSKKEPLGEKRIEKERSTNAKALHMSINFSSQSRETRKMAPVFHHTERKRPHMSSSDNMSKDSLSLTPQTTTNKASVNVLPKQPPFDSLYEDRRRRRLLSQSISGGIIAAGKPKHTSEECQKSSSANGSKFRSSIESSPFRFKSEERAAKRKEFFQKLEEKVDAKEQEKKHLQKRSKIPPTRSHSPLKRGKKLVTSLVKDSSPLPPPKSKRPSVDTRKSKASTTQLVTSFTKKNFNAHENSSPNIRT